MSDRFDRFISALTNEKRNADLTASVSSLMFYLLAFFASYLELDLLFSAQVDRGPMSALPLQIDFAGYVAFLVKLISRFFAKQFIRQKHSFFKSALTTRGSTRKKDERCFPFNAYFVLLSFTQNLVLCNLRIAMGVL